MRIIENKASNIEIHVILLLQRLVLLITKSYMITTIDHKQHRAYPMRLTDPKFLLVWSARAGAFQITPYFTRPWKKPLRFFAIKVIFVIYLMMTMKLHKHQLQVSEISNRQNHLCFPSKLLLGL